jgi:hypothetical protein
MYSIVYPLVTLYGADRSVLNNGKGSEHLLKVPHGYAHQKL